MRARSAGSAAPRGRAAEAGNRALQRDDPRELAVVAQIGAAIAFRPCSRSSYASAQPAALDPLELGCKGRGIVIVRSVYARSGAAGARP